MEWEAAARAAGVRIRELHAIGDLAAADLLMQGIWGEQVLSIELLRVIEHSGGYLSGAYRDRELVGACVGLLSSLGLHSHVAGAVVGERGRGVGWALKLHQRAWALERGITVVTWTYDPLVRRNAYFNIDKLGALPTDYLPDFYGPMTDEINAGVPSDRLMIHWALTAPRVVAATRGERPSVQVDGYVVALDAKPDGSPALGRADAARLLVRVPPDIEAMRVARPQCAARWRAAVREVLGGLMGDGAVVIGFLPDGWYVLNREGAG